MKGLEDYINEAVAKRTVGKYTSGQSIDSVNDLDIGEKVRIKDLDGLKDGLKVSHGGVTVNDQMYRFTGNIVTIKSLYKDGSVGSVSVIENGYYWPIWALERI